MLSHMGAYGLTEARFSLVLASQCAALGEGARIAGLDEAARGLDAVLRDPLRGSCAAALADSRSLLLDQDRATTYAAVWEAAHRASREGGLLVLAWVGHGMAADGDFYVLPQGSTPLPGHPDGPYHLTQHLKEILGSLPELDVLVLVDACASGDAPAQAASGWTRLNQDARRRFQILSATNLDEPAWNCTFTRAAVSLLRLGDITAGDRLAVADLRRAAKRASADQQPVLLTWDGSGRDTRMWLARNAALLARAGSLPALCRADLPQLRAALRHYRPTRALAQVVCASEENRYVVVRGPAGCGKTTLLAALCRPEVANGAVPEGFVHGLWLLKLNESAPRVARALAAQLAVTVAEFPAASAVFEASVPRVKWDALPEVERVLLGPLRHLPSKVTVRIALDGFDQLSQTAAADLISLIEGLCARTPGGPDVRVIVSSRPGAAPPAADTEIAVDAATDSELRAFLRDQQVHAGLVDRIAEASEGSWLVASLLAAHVRATPTLTAAEVPQGLAAVYDQIFDTALYGGASWDVAACPERVLFTVLSAAGPGAVLPAELLQDACRRLGAAQVTKAWLQGEGSGALPAGLRRLVVRSSVGETSTVLFGLFHQTLVDHLADKPTPADSLFTVDVVEGHRAIAESIAALAPSDQRTPSTTRDPLQDYAEHAEANHLWRSGAHAKALESLTARQSAVPADNLERWKYWHHEAFELFGPDHEHTLEARSTVGYWTGEAGDAREALDLFTRLLADQVRVLGADHSSTFVTRSNLGHWAGQAGDEPRALKIMTELLQDETRVLGPDHPSTLTTRHNIAASTGHDGEAGHRALRLFKELLPDRIRVIGADNPSTLATRFTIALWTGMTGDAQRALELFQELLPDKVRVLGPDHPTTLAARGNIAFWTGETGHQEEARRLFVELLEDQLRVLGPSHPHTLTTRHNIAHRTADARQALDLYAALLPERVRVLGYDHPETLTTRYNIADLTGELGDTREALRLLEELRPVWSSTFSEDGARAGKLRNRIAELRAASGWDEQ